MGFQYNIIIQEAAQPDINAGEFVVSGFDASILVPTIFSVGNVFELSYQGQNPVTLNVRVVSQALVKNSLDLINSLYSNIYTIIVEPV